MLLIIYVAIILFLLKKWSYFDKGPSFLFLVFLLLLKVLFAYFSFEYHKIYFAGGDSRIYLMGAHQLLDASGNVIDYLKLFFDSGDPYFAEIKEHIIYWDAAAEFSFINDNRNCIRYHSIIAFISGRDLWTHLLLINFLSLIGMNGIYIWAKRNWTEIPNKALIFACFLMPGLLFWSSGILKENQSLLFLGAFLYFISQRKASYLLPALITLILLALSRFYFASILVFAFAVAFGYRLIKPDYRRIYLMSLLLLFLLSLVVENPLIELLRSKQEGFILLQEKANSSFDARLIKSGIENLLLLPWSFVNVWIQAQLNYFSSWLFIFPLLENLLLLSLILLLIPFHRKKAMDAESTLLLVVILLLGTFVIGTTVNIHGAIVRYRALFLPFLAILIFSFYDWEKIRKKVKWLNV